MYVESALDLIEKLRALSQMERSQRFSNASSAVFSGDSLEKQIFWRISKLQERSIKCKELENYVEKDVIPTAKRIVRNTRVRWAGSQEYCEQLPRNECILSPSDFGIHNTLVENSGKVVFLDFEYFGWDDPAKLIADFLLHPTMKLSSALKEKWIEGANMIFGPNVIERAALMGPMLQLCWCLILLNDFRTDVKFRRRLAKKGGADNTSSQLERQLKRSKVRLDKLRSTGHQFSDAVMFA